MVTFSESWEFLQRFHRESFGVFRHKALDKGLPNQNSSTDSKKTFWWRPLFNPQYPRTLGRGFLGSIVSKLYYFWYQLWSGFLVVKLRISLVTLTPIFNALSHFMKSNCKVHSIFNFILCLPVLYLRAN